MCGTGNRHLAGPAPHSASYVAPFLCDHLVVKCSLPDCLKRKQFCRAKIFGDSSLTRHSSPPAAPAAW
jgi:hypothetical protein